MTHPMERVLYNLHSQLCLFALRRTSTKSRRLVEDTLLIFAVCGFGALLMAHLSFVFRGSCNKQATPFNCLSHLQGFDRSIDLTHLALIDNNNEVSRVVSSLSPVQECSASCNATSALSDVEIYFSYSKVQGYLLLPPEACTKHNISVQYALISKTDANCFGEPFLQRIIHDMVGPETVMINWFLALQDGSGYVYNPRTRAIIDLHEYHIEAHSPPEEHMNGIQYYKSSNVSTARWYEQLASKFTVVMKTSFLFFITTTLVSFTLRETQGRMLDFTRQLQSHVRSRQPVTQLVLTHVIENLVFVPIMVGIMFFLVEFYRGDKFLAFMVLSLVWVSEVFSVISLRSAQGIQFFPRIFFLLFALFHFYLFSFPFGFAYLAFASTVCFMMHSMLFFWYRYELPAVMLGQVSAERPRMNQPVFLPPPPPAPRATSRSSFTALLPPRLVRQPSHGSWSRGGLSERQPSGLFMEDGDESSSYVYFMGGEVVMHRRNNDGIPDRIVAATTSAMMESNHDTIASDESKHNDDSEDDDNGHEAGEESSATEPPETSALQAIWDIAPHNNTATPRIDNLSRSDDARIKSAPTFPSLRRDVDS